MAAFAFYFGQEFLHELRRRLRASLGPVSGEQFCHLQEATLDVLHAFVLVDAVQLKSEVLFAFRKVRLLHYRVIILEEEVIALAISRDLRRLR